MKKIIILSLLSGLILVGCGSNSGKKETSESKVDQLESRVKELEVLSSSEKEKENKATEIVNTFKEKGLPVFDEVETSKSELSGYDAQMESLVSFGYKPKDEIKEGDMSNVIIIQVCKNAEEMQKIISGNDDRNKNSADDPSWVVKYAVNDKLNTVLTIGSAVSDDDFTKYKEVFESIK
ncbi:hypothetical protein A5881_002928 [Enterococcus termitis]|nr:hypothetical protein A5881_002417 [Enterococcus termitis]